MEKQEQEELKSRRNVAAKQGQRTRQKDCEERESEMGKARGREKGDGRKVDGNQCHKGERMPHLLST